LNIHFRQVSGVPLIREQASNNRGDWIRTSDLSLPKRTQGKALGPESTVVCGDSGPSHFVLRGL
jgi:hypothetical protein